MNELVKSPLNYEGNKFKLLPQLLPLFPQNIDTFVDLFGGSFTVGMNITANKIIYNEFDTRIYNLVKLLSTCDYESMQTLIMEIIDYYKLGKNTKEEYMKLRDNYNNTKETLLLFVLSAFSFNYQIRFNSKGQFNMPVGNRGYSKNMMERFKQSNQLCKTKNIEFTNLDFIDFDISKLTSNDMVYIDPPYLQTVATYTENSAWNLDKELALYEFMDWLNDRGIKFGLSNTMWYHNEENLVLKEWSKKYNVHELDFNYTNNNRHRKNNDDKTVEVYICNY